MRFYTYIFIVLSAFLYSCGGGSPESAEISESDSTITSFNWIEGKYLVMNDQSGFYYEEWKKTDANNYAGKGYFIKQNGADTLYSIKMRLIHEKDKTILFYDVKDQKETKETEFTLTKGENNVYVFENPFRDFPSILQYKILGDNTIEVTERGFEKNKEKVVTYQARRID